MLFTERMKGLELLVLKSDADRVMRYLGFAGCLQLMAEPRESREVAAEERDAAELRLKLQSLAKFLGADDLDGAFAAREAADRSTVSGRASELMALAKPLIDEETELVQKRLGMRQAAEELGAFTRLDVPLSDIQGLSYLAVRLGSVAPERMADVVQGLGRRAVVVALEKPGYLMAIAPRKGRWALDTELARHEFQAGPVSAGPRRRALGDARGNPRRAGVGRALARRPGGEEGGVPAGARRRKSPSCSRSSSCAPPSTP